ncbi:M20/M25/M40 family metallo-hydrolase [Paenibacillus ginsengarvi]|uniref:M20/M25/M40 family metallo-hydrolase n=1 Tax=Paenibacillus ginsengarvi TaxID=400777 RepID=A0A3B0CHC1_9BACL|nr:M20/M25/M40 family metallo-hydrolase [Paenibacillus ginsengarvi]RKN84672.1 M20/M25/M40 family metallo-hydrolase [Paenibacillus ginsengarvi]
MIEQNRLVEQFLQLVKIDSETKHEQEISGVLKTLFGGLGLSVFEDDTAAVTGHGAGNLIFTLDATPGQELVPVLLFTCHMDTVTPGKGIKPRVDNDGYIRSDGTTILGSDDKAGIAAMIEAIQVLKKEAIPHGKLLFVITAGEESGLLGSRAMAQNPPKELQAKYGYALDSNGKVGQIAVAAPTQARIQITIKGRSAHAGVNPEDGISAIQVASKAISRMPLGRIDFETTANIGSFAGGGATNIVCERVDIAAEARSLEQAKLDRQLEAMKRACESATEEMGAKLEFHSEIIYPAYKYDETAPVVKLAMKAIESIGRTGSTFHTGGGSDANMFNGMGIPTVNLAVGYENIHTTEEQMPISELVAVSELVVAIVKEAAKE